METKSIFIAVTGRANAGKSTLTNKLVGEKVAIVTALPQTTRTRINGILTKNNTQYVFIDTPGLHKVKTKLSQHMVTNIKHGVSDVDIVVLIVDATRKTSPIELKLVAEFNEQNKKAILLLNKIDLLKNKSLLLEKIDDFSKMYEFEAIIPVCALTGEGIEHIFPVLDKYAVSGPYFFPEDIATDQTERMWISEIIREKLLNNMYEELPHGIAVEVESYKTRIGKNKEILDLGVVIYCEKSSHKGMVIGKNGELLGKIGKLARIELEDFFDTAVNLQCFVKVKENWRNNNKFISDIGLSSN